ncbi:MAG: polysaccharide deacetylase family protein [Thermoclostridium sp.]|nr:polysaccharide deacetylase family protein [Thermoclostridium sp.]
MFETTICALKDDKACAVSFTTDDALYRSCVFYQSRFKEYGLKGTIMPPTHFICPSPNKDFSESNGFASWEQWQAFLSEGCFDVANHTISHPFLDKISSEQLEDEVNGAQAVLRERFPGQKVICMANPYVITNDAIDAVIRQRHFSARNGGDGYNSLDPTDRQWYRLDFQTALHHSTAEIMNPWIDHAIEKKLWLIEMWHGVDGQWWEPPAAQECDRHLAYLSGKLDTVWSGTMEEVTLYLREKQHATIKTELANESELHISLKTDLDTSLFDFPLTLKTVVPYSWNRVCMVNGSQEQSLSARENGNQEHSLDVRENDGYRTVYYDVVPNTGTIILRKL